MNPLFRLRLLIDRGTWIVPDQVLACSYPRRRRLRAALRAHGVTTLINLHARPHDPAWLDENGIRELHLPVPDFTPPTPAQIEQAIAAIDEAIESARKVAVHCGAGLGRTGTVLACYLVSKGASPNEAIDRIRALRPGSVETRRQVAAIHAYAEVLRDTHDSAG